MTTIILKYEQRKRYRKEHILICGSSSTLTPYALDQFIERRDNIQHFIFITFSLPLTLPLSPSLSQSIYLFLFNLYWNLDLLLSLKIYYFFFTILLISGHSSILFLHRCWIDFNLQQRGFLHFILLIKRLIIDLCGLNTFL